MARTLALLLLSLSGCLNPWDPSEGSTSGEPGETSSTGSSGEASTGTSSGAAASTTEEGSGSGAHSTGGEATSTGAGEATGSTTSAPPVCGDGALAPGEECDDGNLEPNDGCDETCARDRVVFTTSMEFPPGMIGGLGGADSLCKQLAHKADLPRWATFTAWLSDSETDAIDRVHHGRGRYVRPDGVAVADDFEALLVGPLLAPLVVDEFGGAVLGGAWTGTRPDGVSVPAAWHCADWTSSELLELGHYGAVEALDGGWTLIPNPETNPTSCITAFHLYCFEGS